MKLYYKLSTTFVLTFCAALLGCGNTSKVPPDQPETPENPDQPAQYADSVALLDGYPSGVEVRYFRDYYSAEEDEYCSGYIALIDFAANPKIAFNAVHLPEAATPTAAFASFGNASRRQLVATNAGYFWAGESLSLLIHNSVVESIASNYAYVTVRNATKTVYPVRAALGRSNSGAFEAKWVYCCMDDDSRPYAFPSPLENNEKNKSYLRTPPTSKTEGAELWQPQEAVGGGPMIVYGGENVAETYYWREVLDEGGTAGLSRQPRTAAGATADGKMLLLVCDGRGSNDSGGYTLAEVADVLIGLGAVVAVNLDGGGSSTMVGIDGKVLNRPSDTGESESIVQRSVPTAIIITEEN
ncbi:MAG: phosphodiester glycosidase family protein [Tidjanibacter sp.]|nr:phosphodiester glycosidase family protein [Tidjanibacter sp.]